ncbi:hypothetical protein Chor_008505 [Crotalus horridus]
MMTDFGGGEAPHQGELSARGVRIAEGCVGLLDRGFDRYLDDPFDADQNPQGILNFGTSENKLCFDLLQERLSKPDMNYLEPHLLQYSDTQGIKSFREEIAKFLTEYANASVPLDPEHIIVMNGCCAVFATLSTVLCDPGDGYLIPTPYYGGINSKTWLYGGMQPVHVPLFSEVADEGSQPFQLTVDKLEAAYQGARGKGIRVRALILINPHNPLGDIYPAELLKECLEFAHRYELHVIMDEIYMLSVYGDTTFTSILSLKSLPDPDRTHFMWGFSKVDWLDNVFFPIHKKRLKEAQNILIDGLANVGIPVFKSSGGLYVWADFRKFLKTQTFEAEIDLWRKILDEKLLISPGKAFCCYEPGWFRIVFSDSVDKIILCIQRLQQLLFDKMDEPVTLCSSPERNTCIEPDDNVSANVINTPVDDMSEGYSQLKKIAVF